METLCFIRFSSDSRVPRPHRFEDQPRWHAKRSPAKYQIVRAPPGFWRPVKVKKSNEFLGFLGGARPYMAHRWPIDDHLWPMDESHTALPPPFRCRQATDPQAEPLQFMQLVAFWEDGELFVISLKARYFSGFYSSPEHAFPKPCKTIGKTTILALQVAERESL